MKYPGAVVHYFDLAQIHVTFWYLIYCVLVGQIGLGTSDSLSCRVRLCVE